MGGEKVIDVGRTRGKRGGCGGCSGIVWTVIVIALLVAAGIVGYVYGDKIHNKAKQGADKLKQRLERDKNATTLSPPPSNTTAPVTNGTIVSSSVFDGPMDPTTQRFYDISNDYKELTPEDVSGFLKDLTEKLKTVPIVKDLNVDLSDFEDFAYTVVSYLQDNHYDTILGLLRTYKQQHKLNLKFDKALLTDLKAAFNPENFQKWMKAPYEQGDDDDELSTFDEQQSYMDAVIKSGAISPADFSELNPKEMLDQVNTYLSRLSSSYPAVASKSDLVMSETQLDGDGTWDQPIGTPLFDEEPSQSSDGSEGYYWDISDGGDSSDGGGIQASMESGPWDQSDGQMILDEFQFDESPPAVFMDYVPPTRSYGGRRMLKSKEMEFKPVKIGIVFHCLQFIDAQGNPGPPQYKMYGEEPAKRLVDQSNLLFGETGISFFVKEVRMDIKKYPYLVLGDLKDWQQCAEQGCYEQLAKDHDEDTTLVVNVFVTGSTKLEGCEGYCKANGRTSHIPQNEGIEKEPGQYIWMRFDRWNPDDLNNERQFEAGAVTLAHELGHYLGLQHTFTGQCSMPNDLVHDTAPQLKKPNYFIEAAKYCKALRDGKQVDPEVLKQFNSCVESRGDQPDHVFNLLSYSVDACRMSLTAGQVQRMQVVLKNFRPKLYEHSVDQ